MPIDLHKQLDVNALTEEEQFVLEDLQGNILKGHGREFTGNLFVKFGSEKHETRRGLQRLATKLMSAAHQIEDTARFKRTQGRQIGDEFIIMHIGKSGFDYLGWDWPSDGEPFKAGMPSRGLNDPTPPVNDPHWVPLDADAMILVADSDACRRDLLINDVRKWIVRWATEVYYQEGKAEKIAGEGVEHFGYVDGRSQPLFFVDQREKERLTGGINYWDPSAPLSQVLVKDPNGTDFGYGSYFVFRKLEEDVAGFKKAEEKLGKEILKDKDGNLVDERAGAMIVGRWEDGTPIVMQATEGMVCPVTNNFNYDFDPNGLRCPFHGHIRNSNPRRDHRDHAIQMARRGITYSPVGESRKYAEKWETEKVDGQVVQVLDSEGNPIPVLDCSGKQICEFDEEHLPKKGDGYGLLFQSYQSNLEKQFEAIQKAANNPNFPVPNSGIDPVIGQPSPGTVVAHSWNPTYGEADVNRTGSGFGGFVHFKGGGYFFAPSISALMRL